MEYTIDYFIKKFEAIPEEDMGAGSIYNHCALWHCGVRSGNLDYTATPEAIALGNILKIMYPDNISPLDIVFCINDNVLDNGDTPKECILNALHKVKQRQPTLSTTHVTPQGVVDFGFKQLYEEVL
jgi:hypothetical protein